MKDISQKYNSTMKDILKVFIKKPLDSVLKDILIYKKPLNL